MHNYSHADITNSQKPGFLLDYHAYCLLQICFQILHSFYIFLFDKDIEKILENNLSTAVDFRWFYKS